MRVALAVAAGMLIATSTSEARQLSKASALAASHRQEDAVVEAGNSSGYKHLWVVRDSPRVIRVRLRVWWYVSMSSTGDSGDSEGDGALTWSEWNRVTLRRDGRIVIHTIEIGDPILHGVSTG